MSLSRVPTSHVWAPTPLLVALLLACALIARASWAQTAAGPKRSKSAAKALVQKAQVDYKLGRFTEALDEYSRAYEMFNAPALLFNIGQCHKNLKNHERAVFFFEGYLREETKVDAQRRRLAEELIAESRDELQRQQASEAETRRAVARSPGPPSSSVAAVFGAPRPPPETVPLLDADARGAQSKRPLLRRWWFWTAVGVGTVAVVGGALAYYLSGPSVAVLPSGTLGTLDGR